MIGRCEIEPHQFKDRLEESLGQPTGQSVNGLDCGHSLNRQVGISRRGARLSDQFISRPILDGFLTDPNGESSPLFERGVILAPVADAVSGLLYSWQKKHTTSLHPQLFTQVRATKPLKIVEIGPDRFLSSSAHRFAVILRAGSCPHRVVGPIRRDE